MSSSYQPQSMVLDLVEICGSHPNDGQRMIRMVYPELGSVVLHPDEAIRLAKALRRMVRRIELGDE